MSDFEDNLWREVRRRYGTELADAPDPLQRRSRLRNPVLAGTSLGVVGAGVAAAVVLTAASSSPAFAVTRHADGTVSVVIRRIEGIAGANRRLQRLGIHARAVRVSGGCAAPPPPALARVAVATVVRGPRAGWVRAVRGGVVQRISPSQIPRHQTLIIPAVPAAAAIRLVHGRAVPGAVPACLPPVVFLRQAIAAGRLTGGGGRIVVCRAGIVGGGRAVVTASGPNIAGVNPAPGVAATTTTNGSGTTSTDATGTDPNGGATTSTSTGTGTASNAGTVTSAATATSAGTATGAGTTTDGGSPQAVPHGPAAHWIVSPLFAHCQIDIQRARP